MSLALPATQRSLQVEGVSAVRLVVGRPLPQLESEDVLVHVACVALNPHDGKSIEMSPHIGSTLGLDFAGEIIALGEAVPPSSLSIGTRVCGVVYGNNPERLDNGAFADYVAVPSKLVIRIPDTMSYQQAATFGCGMATSGVLLNALGLNLPSSSESPAQEKKYVLVYGGGTATGTIAIQALKHVGVIPIAISSPHHFSRLRKLGAAETFDYHSPTCGPDIRDYTDNKLAFALDCISDTESMKICYEAIGSQGGQYVSLDPFPLRAHTRRSIRPDWIIMFSQFGKPINWDWPYTFESRPADKEFAENWYPVVEKLLAEGQLESHPFEERSGGLPAVIDGIGAVRRGEVLGHKLVYPIRSCA